MYSSFQGWIKIISDYNGVTTLQDTGGYTYTYTSATPSLRKPSVRGGAYFKAHFHFRKDNGYPWQILEWVSPIQVSPYPGSPPLPTSPPPFHPAASAGYYGPFMHASPYSGQPPLPTSPPPLPAAAPSFPRSPGYSEKPTLPTEYRSKSGQRFQFYETARNTKNHLDTLFSED